MPGAHSHPHARQAHLQIFRPSTLARLVHRGLLSLCSAILPIGKASRDFYLGYSAGRERLFDAPYFVDNALFVRTAAGHAGGATGRFKSIGAG